MVLLRGLIAPSRAQLEPAGNAAIAARDGISPLMPRSMALMDELTLTVGTSVLGTKYIRIPLTIVPKLKSIPLPKVRRFSP